jgi:hypothetical protein
MNQPALHAIDPQTAWLADRRLWQNLDGDHWITQDERNMYAGDEMTDEILRVLNQPVRDYSAAQRRIRSLLDHGFLKVRKLDDGRLEFTKVGVCPEPPEPVDWAEQMNANLRREQAVERKRMESEAEQREKHARFLAGPSQAEQIRELVTQTVREQVAIQLPGAVREGVAAALREQEALGNSAPVGAE